MDLDDSKGSILRKNINKTLLPLKTFCREYKEMIIDEANNNIRAYQIIFGLGAFHIFVGVEAQNMSVINRGMPFIILASVPILYRLTHSKSSKIKE